MPTSPHRPFFSSFLAAFRAQSSPTASASSLTTSKTPSTSQPSHSSAAMSSTTATPSNAASHPRSIATNSKPGATTSALTQLHSPRSGGGTSPLSTSPGYGSSSSNTAQAQAQAQSRERESRFRRGSDSSSEGFRDVLGAEKWYIGGRTQGGEERFFKLGVVRRERSVDRLSLDRLSL